ncbi:hypothetical protein [Thalassotalea crassostreae]|uniref:hypothetical protein n=1 Tax=Thalassotalea crassostreae TaxID=1763536 RepID=UPI00083871C3|nr:hypothetical protein [Thalassotalea crassostreae]
MSNAIDTFIYEGITRYKKANEVYHTFRRELQNKLQLIIKTRDDWGDIVPDLDSIKSTTYWPEYPLINARVQCEWHGEQIIIMIALNWYDSGDDLPLLALWIEKGRKYWPSQESFAWSEDFTFEKSQLRYKPNPDSYVLEDEFDKIFNEFLNFTSKY